MGAYIINIPDSVDRVIYTNVDPMNGKTYIASYSVDDLTPYTEPDLEQVRKESYDKGYDDAAEEKYNDGLADAWEAARKICTNWVLPDSVLSKIFGIDKTIDDVMKENTASEAIEKIRQYEQEKEEQIQVGDEVATDAGNRASVLYENPDGTQVFVFKSDGTAAWWTKSALHRTGRNFFEIATVLKKMRGEQDG